MRGCYGIEVDRSYGGEELALMEYAGKGAGSSQIMRVKKRRDTPNKITSKQASQAIPRDRETGHPLALLL